MTADLPLRTTALTQLHRDLGARMVPFAGYTMPLQFAGIVAEHTHTRTSASLFDVSHMGQMLLKGDWPAAAAFLETHTPSDLRELTPGQMRYTLLLNERGGILDDLMVLRRDSDVLLVVNAARKAVDYQHLAAALPGGLTLHEQPDWSLLALQGPRCADVLAQADAALSSLPFMSGRAATLWGTEVYITRSGYTGEDGYEISVAQPEHAVALAQKLLENTAVKPAGLGARDTLRLEAGLCLYGHELTEDVTPSQASLNWVIGKRRRVEKGFAGDSIVLQELADGAPLKRIGLVVDGRVPVREETPLQTADGLEAGIITSGSAAPTVGAPVAMALVRAEHAKNDRFAALVRGKPVALRRFTLPFIKHRYYKG